MMKIGSEISAMGCQLTVIIQSAIKKLTEGYLMYAAVSLTAVTRAAVYFSVASISVCTQSYRNCANDVIKNDSLLRPRSTATRGLSIN